MPPGQATTLVHLYTWPKQPECYEWRGGSACSGPCVALEKTSEGMWSSNAGNALLRGNRTLCPEIENAKQNFL